MTFPSCPAEVNGKTRRNMNEKERTVAGREKCIRRLIRVACKIAQRAVDLVVNNLN